MVVVKREMKDIIPYANNAKEHPQWQIDQIKASVVEFGFNDPIAVDEKGVIIEGHGRFLALQQLGYTQVEVIAKRYYNLGKRDIKLIRNDKEVALNNFLEVE